MQFECSWELLIGLFQNMGTSGEDHVAHEMEAELMQAVSVND